MFNKTKEYKIEGEFIIKEKEGTSMSIEWWVNGKKGKLPKELVGWIAKDYIREKIDL